MKFAPSKEKTKFSQINASCADCEIMHNSFFLMQKLRVLFLISGENMRILLNDKSTVSRKTTP